MTTTDQAVERLRVGADELREVARTRPAWDDPTALYDAVSALDEATRTLHVIVTHAGWWCSQLASFPALRVDDMGSAVDPAALAYEATATFESAGHSLYNAHAGVQAAHNALSRLYLDAEDHT